MNYIQTIILGLVQGLTEFIPVSSTGHLILMRRILDLPLEGTLSFDAILQLATGLAVLVYFWNDIWNLIKTFFSLLARKNTETKNETLFFSLIIGTIPAVIFGLLLQKYMDTVFRGAIVVAFSLIAGSILFYLAERKYNHYPDPLLTYEGGETLRASTDSRLSLFKSFLIGLFQCLALVPGFSRSGATISGGLITGLNREVAIRFSFLLSLPIIFGSGFIEIWGLYRSGVLVNIGGTIFLASIFAFLSGLLSIHFLLKFLKNYSLNYFGAYRILLAIVILLWL